MAALRTAWRRAMTARDWATCVATESVSNPGPAGGSSSFETRQHVGAECHRSGCSPGLSWGDAEDVSGGLITVCG